MRDSQQTEDTILTGIGLEEAGQETEEENEREKKETEEENEREKKENEILFFSRRFLLQQY
jgi:predicted RNase H-like nuclease (RuvC/YqgF family)